MTDTADRFSELSTPKQREATPYNERIAIIRSLLGHRHPSEHLCVLIEMAAQGADWSEIHAVDSKARGEA